MTHKNTISRAMRKEELKVIKIVEIAEKAEKEDKLLEGRTCYNCKHFPCPLICLLWRFVEDINYDMTELHHSIRYFTLLKALAYLCPDFSPEESK